MGDVCEKHTSQCVEVFCVEERRAMCILCLAEAEGRGQRKRCVPIVDVVDALMAEVRDMYSSLQEQKVWHTQAVLDLDHQAHKEREECLAEIHGVRHVFGDVRSALEGKEKSVLDGLVRSKNAALEKLERERRERVGVVVGINQQLWGVRQRQGVMSAPGPLLEMRDTLSGVCGESMEVQKRELPRVGCGRVKFLLFNVETLASIGT